MTFLWKLCLFFQSYVYSLSFLLKPQPWSNGNVSCLTFRVALRIAEQFRIYDLRNEELSRLFTWIFIDLIIRRFKLVNRGFELVSCGFELATRRFKIVTRGFKLVTREFELITRGFELALLNLNSYF